VTTFYSILIALAVLIPGLPLTSWLAGKAGIPDYGYNPDQKAGWRVLYIFALSPTCLALMWILGIAFIAIMN